MQESHGECLDLSKTSARLTTGEVVPTLLQLTIPMIWGLFSIIGFNLADTYFVGQLGSLELSALGFTIPVVMVLGTLTLGLGTGTASALARALGEGNPRKARRLATDSLVLALLIVSVLVVAGILTIEPLFRALGAPESVLPLIEDYMSVWYVAMIFLVIPMVGNSIIRATGDTKFPGLIMTFAALMNFVLDPFLIFGWAGLPALGVKGAAIATLISRVVTTIPSLYILCYREKILDSRLPRLSELLNSFKEILYVGIPAAGSNMIQPITGMFITSMLAGYGPESVAAFGLVQRMESFVLIIALALASALGPFLGQNWGAGKKERVEKAIWVSVKFCLVWGVISAAALGFCSDFIVRAFSDDPAICTVAVLYLVLVPWTYGLESVRLIVNSALNAIRKPLPATGLMVLRMFGIYIPLAWTLSSIYGIPGIFWATCLANLIVGLLSLFTLWRILRSTFPEENKGEV